MATIHEKLSEIMGVVGYVQKDATNDSQGYRYASAEAVLRKVNAECSKRGVSVASSVEVLHYSEHTTNGKSKMRAAVRMTLKFTDGAEAVSFQGIGEGMDAGDKALLKANTSALKYALASGFLISWGDDPEADATTDRDVKESRPTTDRKPAPEQLDAEAILDKIRKATTIEQLNELKGVVRSAVASDLYGALRDAWTERKAFITRKV